MFFVHFDFANIFANKIANILIIPLKKIRPQIFDKTKYYGTFDINKMFLLWKLLKITENLKLLQSRTIFRNVKQLKFQIV